MKPVDNLSDDHRDRLVRLDAELSLGLGDPAAVVWLACDLLVAGVASRRCASSLVSRRSG